MRRQARLPAPDGRRPDGGQGFTIVEAVIYFGLFALLLVGIVTFVVNILGGYRTFRLRDSVLAQGQTITQNIAQETRHATRIYRRTSRFNVSPGQLSLETVMNPPTGETRTYVDFYADGNILYRKQEGSDPIALSAENVIVDAFQLTRIGCSAQLLLTLRSSLLGRGGVAIAHTFRTTLTPRLQIGNACEPEFQAVGFPRALQAGSPDALCDRDLEMGIGRIEGDAISATRISAWSASNRITGNAFYGTTWSGSGVVDGTRCQIGALGCPLATLPALPAVDLHFWQDAATRGGTCVPPQCQADGDFELNSQSATLGPAVITDDLQLTGSSTLTLTGPIWVRDRVEVNSTSRIRLDPVLGSYGTVIVADGVIQFTGSTAVEGTGQANSGYVLFVSKKNGAGCDFDIELNSTGDRSFGIFYAINGEVQLTDTTRSGAVAAQEADLWGNSVVTYNTAMNNALFSTGP